MNERELVALVEQQGVADRRRWEDRRAGVGGYENGERDYWHAVHKAREILRDGSDEQGPAAAFHRRRLVCTFEGSLLPDYSDGRLEEAISRCRSVPSTGREVPNADALVAQVDVLTDKLDAGARQPVTRYNNPWTLRHEATHWLSEGMVTLTYARDSRHFDQAVVEVPSGQRAAVFPEWGGWVTQWSDPAPQREGGLFARQVSEHQSGTFEGALAVAHRQVGMSAGCLGALLAVTMAEARPPQPGVGEVYRRFLEADPFNSLLLGTDSPQVRVGRARMLQQFENERHNRFYQ